jgi:hypothetical protein
VQPFLFWGGETDETNCNLEKESKKNPDKESKKNPNKKEPKSDGL